MRLWHESLLPYLPRQQLLGQHRECCALRGAGWGRPHSVVNYVFTHSPSYLIAYHFRVMDEMERRGYHPDKIWRNQNYRGKTLGYQDENWDFHDWYNLYNKKQLIFPEHNSNYLLECINNLKEKGIEINYGKNF